MIFKVTNKVKKVKLPIHAMKAYVGTRCIAPLILNLGNRWRSAVSLAPLADFPPGKELQYLPNRRLGGPQTGLEGFGEDKTSWKCVIPVVCVKTGMGM